jgi:hypothetical protein
MLINKLILNKYLKKRYEYYGLCKECKQINTGEIEWCQSCNSKRFRQNFNNWTSGNHHIDKLIQTTQLKADSYENVLEWIEFNRFKKIRDSKKNSFGITYKAIWKDGFIRSWDYENNQWDRFDITFCSVALVCLDITVISKGVRYILYIFF